MSTPPQFYNCPVLLHLAYNTPTIHPFYFWHISNMRQAPALFCPTHFSVCILHAFIKRLGFLFPWLNVHPVKCKHLGCTTPWSDKCHITQITMKTEKACTLLASSIVPPPGLLLLSCLSCPTLCDPIDSSPPGSAVPGSLQARTLEWVAISFSNAWKWKVKVKLLSRVWLFATPWTAAHQAPPSMGFSRQEYWSGVPLPSPPPGLRHPKSSLPALLTPLQPPSLIFFNRRLLCLLYSQNLL